MIEKMRRSILQIRIIYVVTTIFLVVISVVAYVNTPQLNIVLSLVALFILLFSYFELSRSLDLSQHFKIKLEETIKTLEKKNEELQEGGERYLKIFDNSPVAMTFAEIESNQIVYANNLFYNSFGYPKEEVIGRTTEDLNLVSAEENERLIPVIMSHLQEDRSIEELKALSTEERAKLLMTLKEKMLKHGYEILYTRKNGETFYAIVFVEVIEIGNRMYSLTTYQDISERKEVQKQLADEKAFAEMVIENDPAMIVAYDENLNIIVWNKKCEEYSGLKKEEVLGESIFILFPETNQEQKLNTFNLVLKDGKSLHYPMVELKQNNGFGERWIMPLRNTSQQIIGILEITRDITQTIEMTTALEQQNIELEKINDELNLTATTLQKSEERFNRMITEVKDYAIIFLNKDGIIENWNEGAEKILGYNTSEIIGKNFSLFYTEDNIKNNLAKTLLTIAAEEGKAVQEGWRIRKNGSKFWGSIVITALHDGKGEIIGFSKVTRDLTDKKMAEDKLVEANKLLEQKNAELSKMNKELESVNYISSHDLQEPLRQIQIFASRISDNEKQNLSDDGKKYFDKMNNAAKRMQNLIADLLTYSRSKTEERKFAIVDINQIVDQVKEEFAEIIEEKHATIDAEDLGDAYVIPFQFRQIMYNLIGNALKFSKPEIPPHIKIFNKKINSRQVPGTDPNNESEYHHISISDNGIGFEPQYKDRIFGVFQRLSSKDKVAGTGIGLAIVKNIVENHQGFVKATGELNKGATIDIFLPTIQLVR